jgi:anti-sigma B factor antagonist
LSSQPRSPPSGSPPDLQNAEELAVSEEPRAGGDTPEFRCEVHPEPARTVVCVAGDVDMASAPALRDALQRAAEREAGPVVVDLAGCGFLDSSGLAVLVEANNRARTQGAHLALRSPNERVVRLLEVTHLDGELAVEP